MTVTIGRWVDLPNGASSPLRADEPLGAGVLQIAASNANFGCRVNNLRVLYEMPGQNGATNDLEYSGVPSSFPWNAPIPSGDAPYQVMSVFAGIHRIRHYGETGAFPKVTLTARIKVSGGDTGGLILLARPTVGPPVSTDLFASTTTTSSTFTTKSVSLVLTPSVVATRVINPRLGTAFPIPEPVERGQDTAVAFYLGAWKTGTPGTNLVTVTGATLYLEIP